MTEEDTKVVCSSNYSESVSSIYNYLVNQVESRGGGERTKDSSPSSCSLQTPDTRWINEMICLILPRWTHLDWMFNLCSRRVVLPSMNLVQKKKPKHKASKICEQIVKLLSERENPWQWRKLRFLRIWLDHFEPESAFYISVKVFQKSI